jgi:Tfp pilus assembly protein PilF
MYQRPKGPRNFIRALLVGIVLAALSLGVTACSDSSGSGSSSGSPDAKRASKSLNAGLKAHAAGDLTTAAADYKKTLRYDPRNKFAYYNLALIDQARGNYGLAEQKYRAALRTDPRYEPALFNLAILRTARAPKEAVKLYKRAVAAKPKDASAWLNLGLLQRAAGKQAEGDHSVARALALNPRLKDPAKPASVG